MANERVIVLRGEPVVDEQVAAASAITPGHLIEFDASGDFQPHATAAGSAATWFALERDEAGNEIDVDYAAGDRVKAGFFAQGHRVNALVASGQDLAAGDELESAGDGTLTAGTTNPVARSAETVNTGAAVARVAVIIV